MKALTAIAATAYAIGLWMFAPQSVWERELAAAKHNQQQSDATLEPTPIPQPQPQPQPEPTPETTPEPEPVTAPMVKPEAIPEPIEQSIPTSTGTDYTTMTINQLREEAKNRKLQWRPLVDGKRKPLNKPQLIELLTA